MGTDHLVEIYGKRLRIIRDIRGISAEALCLKIGLNLHSYRNYENAAYKVPKLVLISLCSVLDIPSSFLTDKKAAILWDGDKVTGKSRKRKS